jgi:hypothetical protein
MGSGLAAPNVQHYGQHYGRRYGKVLPSGSNTSEQALAETL